MIYISKDRIITDIQLEIQLGLALKSKLLQMNDVTLFVDSFEHSSSKIENNIRVTD